MIVPDSEDGSLPVRYSLAFARHSVGREGISTGPSVQMLRCRSKKEVGEEEGGMGKGIGYLAPAFFLRSAARGIHNGEIL